MGNVVGEIGYVCRGRSDSRDAALDRLQAMTYASGNVGRRGGRNDLLAVRVVLILIFGSSVFGQESQTASLQQRLADNPAFFLEIVRDGSFPEILAALEAGADVGITDEYGQTALMYASGRGDVSIFRSLLAAGAKPNPRSHAGWTALHYVARDNPHADVTKLLLEAGADLEALTPDGMTPHGIALESGNREAARALEHEAQTRREAAEREQEEASRLARAQAGANLVQQVLDYFGRDRDELFGWWRGPDSSYVAFVFATPITSQLLLNSAVDVYLFDEYLVTEGDRSRYGCHFRYLAGDFAGAIPNQHTWRFYYAAPRDRPFLGSPLWPGTNVSVATFGITRITGGLDLLYISDAGRCYRTSN